MGNDKGAKPDLDSWTVPTGCCQWATQMTDIFKELSAQMSAFFKDLSAGYMQFL
jgi:hypothetical protein